MQAKRVADAVELFGVNTFSSLDDGNVWGSWPADYRPDSVIAALKYIVGDTQFNLMIREYHYSGRGSMQTEWLSQILNVFPDTKVTICVGANGTTNDVPSMLSIPGCKYWEGLNEPNTDFGSGEVPTRQTMDIQNDLWTQTVGRHEYVMGPSVVAGTPHPEGWITGYFGDQMNAVNKIMTYGNGHYYPPTCPDLIGNGSSLQEYVGGLWQAYAQHPIMLTEFHPTLYNSEGNKPDQPGWNGERDAYYTMLSLFRSVKCGCTGLWWYALFDYGTVYQCGLFPKSGRDQPRPAATALRNLCEFVSDPGRELRTFNPGKLNVDVQGAEFDLWQSSTGVFYLPLWRSAPELGGVAETVTISVDPPPTVMNMIDVLTGHITPLRNGSIQLDNSANVVRIEP